MLDIACFKPKGPAEHCFIISIHHFFQIELISYAINPNPLNALSFFVLANRHSNLLFGINF
jgi:hypothetical protein